uniref:Cytochrome P450 3A n=1 Tax=Cyclopterus lumpus TaxID=8103 RepID=A0A8C2XFS3_CYCLU
LTFKSHLSADDYCICDIYGYAPYGFFKKLGISGFKPMPFIGTFLEYRKGIHNVDTESLKNIPDYKCVVGWQTALLATMDTAMIKTILVKECYSIFTNRRVKKKYIVGEMPTWSIIPVCKYLMFLLFTFGQMYSIMLRHSSNLIKSLHKKVEEDEVIDVKEWVFLDVVTSTAFSVDIDSINHPSDPFVANIKRMVKFNFLNPPACAFWFPFLSPILEKMDVSFLPAEVMKFFYSSLETIKSDRNKNEHKFYNYPVRQ